QQDGMDEGQADPNRAEDGQPHRDDDPLAGPAPHPEEEEQREGSGGQQEDIEGGAEVGGEDYGGKGDIGGHLHWPQRRRHQEVLAQAEQADRDHRHGEDEAAENDDRDREDDPRDRDKDSPCRLPIQQPAAPAWLAWRPLAWRRLLREHLVVEEILNHLGPLPEAPAARLELAQRVLEGLAAEVRPELIAEDQL